MNIWLSGGDAACQIVTRPGIMSGQIEIASPAKLSRNSVSVSTNGTQCLRPAMLRHKP